LRLKYIAYKYTRRGRSEIAFQTAWDSFGAWPQPSAIIWKPPTDVYETPSEIDVIIELAGVTEEDMSVTLFSDLLVVEGTRNQPPCADMNACHQLGIKYGDFRSEIHIAVPVDSEKISAAYKNGLLKVVLRKLR
jgi:HSP20 family protein